MARRRSLVAAALALATVAITASGCADQPSQEEFDAALADFDALPDEVKAYACADDYYAAQYGLQGFVIVERCGSPTGVAVTDSRPLSAEFERDQVDYAETFYADNPPLPSDLDRVDVDVLCADDEALIRDDIEQWRAETEFPSWEGVEYVPSVEGELARLRVWQEAACPLVEE